MRQGDETGLVDWQVAVDENYFAMLRDQAIRQVVDETTLLITDPFNNTLIVKKIN